MDSDLVAAAATTRQHRRRRGRDRLFWGLCVLAFAIIAAPTIAVLVSVFHTAWPALGLHTLTKDESGAGGGLQNAIYGTLLLLLGVLIIAGTIGVGAGIYLAEFSSPRFGGVLRFFSEILAGMPSIVIGYIGYVTLVVGFHWQYSLLAAILALSVLVLPYIVKTTEVALLQVPTALREAAAGLGLTRGLTVRRILLPTAVPGITSGLIIALAISTGETAPLLFTAGFADTNPTLHFLHSPIGYLTGVTFNAVSQPGAAYHAQASAAAAVTLIILIILIAIGRVISARSRRKTARMAL
jgi:phosphate transport system permease protein